MNEQRIWIRTVKDHIFTLFVALLALLSVVPLILILYHIVGNGIAYINWSFLVSLPNPVGVEGGGISNAIVGTVILVVLACVLSVPVGIAAGIYLSENRYKRLSYWVSVAVDILQSIPSIVLGIIAYLWVVRPAGTFSAFSGGVALALMMLPIIVRATDETLKLIPESLKEAALALGVPYWRTILRVILPAGLSGILTGILLGISRIAGETAPLLFTAFGSPFMVLDPTRPMNALPLLIFNYATSPYQHWHSLAWAASLVLVAMVLIFNLTAKVISTRWKVRF
ncbi:MAG TPA: phosphate ABC transporter permease PstA [Acidobacteriota bacterium]|nr:phosphate ABC transporter permease PstA [Acidobacteriota bacterium]